MICVLTDKEQVSLQAYLLRDLRALAIAKKPLDIKTYLTKFYDERIAKNQSPERAMTFTQLIPGNIIKLSGLYPEIQDHLYDTGTSFDDLIKLSRLFGNNIDNVANYLGKELGSVTNTQTLIKDAVAASQSPGFNSGQVKTIAKAPFQEKVISPQTTTGQELNANEDKKIRYAFQRQVINQVLTEQVAGDSRNITTPEGGLLLSLVHHTKLADPSITSGTALVITDKEGKILKFKDGQLDDTGSPMFYGKRTIELKKGRYTAIDTTGKDSLAPLSAIIRQAKENGINLTEKQADEQRQALLKREYDIEQYINQHPDQVIRNVITGGSLGNLSFDFNTHTPLTQYTGDFNPTDPRADDNGISYLNIKGIEKPIPLQRDIKDKALVDKLVSILIDPIKTDTGRDITPVERYRLVKQFMYENDNFLLRVEDSGLTIKVNGNTLDTTDLIQAKKTLTDYLGAQALTKEGIRYDVNPFNINADFLNTGIPLNDFLIENGVLKDNPVDYSGWLKQHTYINYKLNSDGKLIPLNSYFSYQTIPEELEKVYPQVRASEPVSKPSEAGLTNQGSDSTSKLSDRLKEILQASKKASEDDPTLRKSSELKSDEVKATEDQISQAKTWWTNHPLSKHLQFNEMFNIMNSDRVADFFTSGINLYHGSDYSDLYHESWHAFSQLFLTKDEKYKLYNEIKKTSGSFTDHLGQKITFSKASYLQIEEYLAEDFRKYMLSDGKRVLNQSPIRNTLYRRIYNFLKSLFAGTSIAQEVIDQRAVNTVNDLYNKLRVGNVPSTFSSDNVMFNILAKGATATDKSDPIQELDPSTSKLAIDTINVLFSDFIDYHNIDNTGSLYTNRYLTSQIGRSNAYKFAKGALQDKYNEIFANLDKVTNPVEKEGEIKKLNTLSWMIKNFGDPENLNAKKGLIAYHIEKDKLNPLSEELDDNNTPETWGQSGNETSVYGGAKQEIRNLVRGIHKVDSAGNRVENSLGFGALAEFKPLWDNLTNTLEGLSSPAMMKQALIDKGNDSSLAVKAMFGELLSKLGPADTKESPRALDPSTYAMWSSFWQTFNRPRWPQITQTVDQKADGKFESKVGQAYGDYKKAQKAWNNIFTSGRSSSTFIKQTGKSTPYLDINGLLTKYPNATTVQNDPLRFLSDIGVDLDDNQGIRDELREGQLKNVGKYMLKRLKTLQEVKQPVHNLNDLFTLKIKGEAEVTNYNRLAQLQVKYSEQFSNLSVTIPGEKTVFEHSLNSSMSRVTQAINSAKDYQDLISSYPYMALLDKSRSPWAAFSVQLSSIFDFSKAGGPRRVVAGNPVIFKFENMAGTTFTKDELATNIGTASSKADEISKFLMDLSFVLQRGKAENPRPGEKSSSPITGPNYLLTPYNTNNRSLYIEPSYLADASMDDVIYKSVLPYLIAEHTRVQIMRNLKPGDPELNYPAYVKNGKNFILFDDLLFPETKEALYKIPKDQLAGYLKTDAGKDLQQDIFESISFSFNKMFDDTQALYDKAAFIAPNIIAEIKNGDKSGLLRSLKTQDLTSTLLRTYTINSWMHNTESMIMLYGDMAMYKSAEEFHKRLSPFSSTGDIFQTDPTSLEYVHQVLGMPEFSKDMKTAIMSDPEIESALYNHMKERIEHEIRERFTTADKKGSLDTSKKSLEEMIQERADLEMAAYKNMKVGDAQGWISFPYYRALAKLSNKWDEKTQEALYQRIMKGEPVTIGQINKFFPIRKYQYAGALKTQGLPVNAVHKYSLFPLIPTVIQSAPVLQKLADKLKNENFAYATLNSGSKIVSVTDQGKMDTWDDSKPFTPNIIHLEFLKDQQNMHDEFDGTARISTQQRKVIEAGAFEGGVPIDFMPGANVSDKRDAWTKLSEKQKEGYKKYRQIKAFEKAIKDKTDGEKKRLLKQIGWNKGDKGKATKKLVEVIRKELERRDLGDHEADYIDLKDALSGLLKHDLSYSLSAGPIEKALASMVNKRLIWQKANGGGLIQVSSLGWDSPGKPPLKGYRIENGKTRAAQCKIALQGDFLHLLQLDHKDGKKIEGANEQESLKRLNESIQDESWLDKGDHRRMITLLGTRIPVQELNSMEFAEVAEFLPQASGNSIVVHPDIVAKSGSDFDVDKLTMMMPNIKLVKDKPEMFRNYTEAEAKKMFGEYQAKKSEKGFDPSAENKLMEKLFGLPEGSLNEELIQELQEEGTLDSFEDYYDNLNGTKAAENNLMQSMQAILEDPDNYASLVRPNTTFTMKPIAEELRKLSEEKGIAYNPRYRVNSQGKGISWSRLVEPRFNLHVHQANTIALQTLAISATDNTANVNFNRVGAHLMPEYDDKGTLKALTMRFKLANGQKAYNSLKYEGRQAISLSHLLDAQGVEKISDVISQIINGELEVAKDDWAYYIQANKEIIPTLHFMIQAGIPARMAVYFASQPLVQEYINQIRLARSTFAAPLGTAPTNKNFYQVKARGEMLSGIGEDKIFTPNKYGFNLPIAYIDKTGKLVKNTRTAKAIKMIYEESDKLAKANPDVFTETGLLDRLKTKDTSYSDADRAVLLHFLEVEDMAKAVSSIKYAMNFDTKKSGNVFMAMHKQAQVANLESKEMIPFYIIKNLLGEEEGTTGSAISSLYTTLDFMREFMEPLFRVRANKQIGDFLMSKVSDFAENQQVFPNLEKASTAFYNDLMSYIFQNSIRSFNLTNTPSYKGFNTSPQTSATPVSVVPYLKFGAFVKNGTLYYDINQLLADATADSKGAGYTKQEYQDRGLAKIERADTFKTKMEYYNFVFERESLRDGLPPTVVKTDPLYRELVTKNKGDEALSYEQYLRDKALENIGNSWKLFQSDNSYADQVINLRDTHPDLSDNYSLLNILDMSESKNFKNPLKNLQLRTNDLTGDDINAYHYQLEQLANPAVKKVDDRYENARISTLFQKFPMVAFLQSGLTTSGAFSMTRLVPNTGYIMHMENAVGKFMNALSDPMLQKFYDKFLSNNSDYATRSRYKDYTVDRGNGRAKLTGDVNTEIPIYNSGLGYTIYDPTKLTDTNARQLTEHVPDTIFVFNQKTGPLPGGLSTGNDGHFNSKLITNNVVLGIPTRVGYSDIPDGKNAEGKIVKRIMSDDTLEDNKHQIDQAIESLKQLKESGYTLSFNQNGYGQGMIGYKNDGVTPMPNAKGKPGFKTFMYLSQKLYEEFNYVNKNFPVQPGFNLNSQAPTQRIVTKYPDSIEGFKLSDLQEIKRVFEAPLGKNDNIEDGRDFGKPSNLSEYGMSDEQYKWTMKNLPLMEKFADFFFDNSPVNEEGDFIYPGDTYQEVINNMLEAHKELVDTHQLNMFEPPKEQTTRKAPVTDDEVRAQIMKCLGL